MIAPKSGFGGLAGGFVKQIALANVRQLSQRLAPEIDIVGVGGVASGMDAFELILCGASAVQVVGDVKLSPAIARAIVVTIAIYIYRCI